MTLNLLPAEIVEHIYSFFVMYKDIFDIVLLDIPKPYCHKFVNAHKCKCDHSLDWLM